MVRGSKIFLVVILAGLFLMSGVYAGAQEKAPETGKVGEMAPPATAQGVKQPPYSKPYPMGLSPSL